MSLEIKEVFHPSYGNCVEISNHLAHVLVTVEKGPRIVSYGFSQEENLFYTAPEIGDPTLFQQIGGHRVTISPESEDSFYPDNEPVMYTFLPDGVEFTPPKRKNLELQLSMEIHLCENSSDMMVVHTVTNHSREGMHLGLWSVTMLQPGGNLILPCNPLSEDATVPNQILAFWPGSSPKDQRFAYGDENRYMKLSAEGESPFVLGTNNTPGWAAYVKDDLVFMQQYVHTPDVWYPNHGCSYRVALKDGSLQSETYSPIYWLEPGSTIRHAENFSLFHTPENNAIDSDKDIYAFLRNLK